MADAAARREARRKRILENSENRLQRITGVNVSVREDNKSSSSFTESGLDPKSGCDSGHEIERIVPETKSNPQPREPQSEIFYQTYIKDEEDFLTNSSPVNSSNDLRRRNDNLRGVNDEVRNEKFSSSSEREPNITLNKVTNDSQQDPNTHDSIRRVSAQESFPHSVFKSKWILVVLAAFVNTLYILQLQHLCGKTILAPFFTLMLMRLHLGDNKSEVQGGSMLSAALILCNIRPGLVYNLRWILRTVKMIAEEFSIYIFSFVIFYNTASYYWNDIDITLLAVGSESDGELQ